METMLDDIRGLETVKVRYALNGISYTRELPSIARPALAIVGDSRWLIPMSRRITEAIPNARLEVLEDSFDPSNRCQPEEFNRVLADFLDDIDW